MRLKTLLDAAMKAVDENLVSFEMEFKTLRELSMSLFPTAHFIDCEFKEVPKDVVA